MDILFLIVLTIALLVVFAVDNYQKQRKFTTSQKGGVWGFESERSLLSNPHLSLIIEMIRKFQGKK